VEKQILALDGLAQASREPQAAPLVARVLGELVGRALARALGVLGGLVGVAQQDGSGGCIERIEADADGGIDVDLGPFDIERASEGGVDRVGDRVCDRRSSSPPVGARPWLTRLNG
jgi:hypothetical protein